ncbi:hypothetical protein [Ornithinimicrobium sp. INDO-MA30-4]|uniref:hypothetical protein n=1 Tax=Ornithinimicrobium sp. INDO-MA30-4 TaxID=2908651 RepID=UPI001F1FDB6E|nr:hypothetical protein [Ornithinimicrobium sp. INDO-MA30-4]UJH71711.1 hypothetical protein L0A91_04495 [Ornithinimicrobium sp. INDO-MA30-4]
MARKGIRPDLVGRSFLKLSLVIPALEDQMSQFMGQCTALSHRIPATSNPNEDGASNRVAHGQAMLVWFGIEDRYVTTCRLLNERNQIAERLHPEPMVAPELIGRLLRLLLHAEDHRAAEIPWSSR